MPDYLQNFKLFYKIFCNMGQHPRLTLGLYLKNVPGW